MKFRRNFHHLGEGRTLQKPAGMIGLRLSHFSESAICEHIYNEPHSPLIDISHSKIDNIYFQEISGSRDGNISIIIHYVIHFHDCSPSKITSTRYCQVMYINLGHLMMTSYQDDIHTSALLLETLCVRYENTYDSDLLLFIPSFQEHSSNIYMHPFIGAYIYTSSCIHHWISHHIHFILTVNMNDISWYMTS